MSGPSESNADRVGAPTPTLLETFDAAPPEPNEAPEPLRIGRYTIVRRLGEGGMGTVWSAYDEMLDRRVAIKVLSGRNRSEQSRGRMLREAKALARLNHPNVVQVFEVGELGDDLFVAMEFIRGESMQEWLAHPHTFAEILGVFVQAGRGLEAVHHAKLVHRDFKPDNVVVGEDGRVRLIDFGIARIDGEEPDTPFSPPKLELADSKDRLTRTGQFIGTPAFTSPEQLRGLAVDPRADQFSFCVSLFRAVFHEPPFGGSPCAAVAVDVLQGDLADPPRPPGVPAGLRPILVRGLAREPERRWPDMTALLAALERLASRRRTTALAIGAAALAGAGFTAAIALPGGDACDGAPAALATVWNDARRDHIAKEFRAAEAGEVWLRAQTRLDAFGAEWIAQHLDACTRHRRGEQSPELLDRRMSCLDDERRELDALLTELEQFDASLVPIANEAVAELQSPSRCADVQRLTSSEATPLDEAGRARAAELSDVLARAEAQERAGRITLARETIAALRPDIDAFAYPPLQIDLHGIAGAIDQQEGRHLDAQREHQARFELAVANHDDLNTLDAALGLAISIGVHQARLGDAQAWVAISNAWLIRLGEPKVPRAIWRELVAGMHEREGRFEEARRELEEAVASLSDLPRREALRPLAIMTNELGIVLHRLHRWSDSEQAFLHARELWLELYGPEHPVSIDPLNNLGSLYLDENRMDDAQRVFEQALVAREKIFGHDHPKIAHLLHNLGVTADKRGDHVAALVRYREALDILERTLGKDDPAVAVVLMAIGEGHTSLGQPGGALPYL
ncbi:MAG TPA: serine/threonine-protein kinase, partial [Nannocystaceae bacterium]|nr:serine/threonine-protein kinase [Nannocystaceae bacterium]